MESETKKKEKTMDPKLKLDLEQYYLVHQSEIDKIDSMVGSLNLAITEILEWRPVRKDPWRTTPLQNAYDREVKDVIYRDEQID
jgi:hypothetical protein